MRDLNHSDDFEQYLQEQVNDHRIHPSDRVWKNIRGRIHTPKKWPALSVFTVLIISALVVGTILNKPIPDSVTPNFAYSLQSPANVQPKQHNNIQTNTQAVNDNISIDQVTSKTIFAAVEKIKIDEAVTTQLSTSELTPENNSSSTIAALQNPAASLPVNNIAGLNDAVKFQSKTNNETAQSSAATFKNIDNYLFNVSSRLKSILNTQPIRYASGGVAFFSNGRNEPVLNDFNLWAAPEKTDRVPSLEKLGKNSSRFNFRFYVTPSISYRHLSEKNQPSQNGKSAALESDYRVDPPKAINHRPATGYETGVGLGYKLNKKFTLTGSLQFNISQYKINAFLYKDETAALTLDEGEYASTVNTVSSLRSIPGTAPLTIKNRYYQISLPLGIEWSILGNEKLNWGVGASVQPTYTFDKQPLIISSNYKNYTDGSAYVRNWNVNTNLETFLGYTTGSYRWQIGPQLRYQVLPSLADKYPNKEYLLNYGLKLGVVKQLK